MEIKNGLLALLMALGLMFSGATSNEGGATNNVQNENNTMQVETVIEPTVLEVNENNLFSVEITVGNSVFLAKFYDNESARAIMEQMPFSLDMDDYAKQEKVAELSFDLPNVATERPNTIKAGEIYLWSSNNLVLFYTTFSDSYSYVSVGYIEDTSGLTEALGSGSVIVTFNVSEDI